MHFINNTEKSPKQIVAPYHKIYVKGVKDKDKAQKISQYPLQS